LNGGSVFLAWDPRTNEEVWRVERQGSSGTLATGGNLVFRGGGGRLYAHDPATGGVLWSGYVGGNSLATPVTYEINGRQYIAVEVAGGGGGGGRGGRGGAAATPARMMAFTLDGEPLPEP
jgi:outer membrane protein assembly factor BamB